MSLTFLEISKSALLNNLAAYREVSSPAKILAVVKSNAYGHGMDIVAEAIKNDVDWFGTTSGAEAIHLRDEGINKPILVLSYYDEDLIEELLRKNISLGVYEAGQIAKISTAAKKLKIKAKVHLKVDTGMNRLGFEPAIAFERAVELSKNPNLILEGMFSHLAASENKLAYSKQQLADFTSLVKRIEDAGISIPLKHIARTASTKAFPDSHWDMVRVGIGLYGLTSYTAKGAKSKLPLIPVVTWKSKLVQVKKVPAGAQVGYNLTYKTTRPSTLAVLPVGYFDGYDRKLSNKGEVLVGGMRCKVAGMVCMNLIILDVTDVPKVAVGDEAVLIGKQGNQEITVDELAKKADTINHEIVTRIAESVERTIVN